MKWILPTLMTIMLFSIWAAFALLVVNPFLQAELPGYIIGRICIWEYVALGLAAIASRFLIKKWGNLELREIDHQSKLILNPRYGVFLGVYFLLAIIIGVWQFWLFSQNF